MNKVITYILAIGLILRIIGIDQSLWLDEATSATVARDMSFSQIVTDFAPGDFHPPLHYLSLKVWGNVFGFSDIALRALSILFGVGLIFAIYKIGEELKNRELGKIAAILVATNPLLIYYSHEVRMYMMVTFFVSLSVYFFLKILKPKAKQRNWVFFGISLAFIALTDYLPLLIIPAFWFISWKLKKNKKWLRKFAMSHLILASGFLLIANIFYSQITAGLGVKGNAPLWWNALGKTSIKNVALIPTKFLIGRIGFTNKYIYAVSVLSGIGIYSYLVLQIKKQKNNLVIYSWLVLPVIIALLLGFAIPVVSYFRLIFILPALYLLAAMGLINLKDSKFLPLFAAAILFNLVFAWFYLSGDQYKREDWKGLAAFIEESSDENSRVIFAANSQMEALKYYNPNVEITGPDGITENLDQIWLMRYVYDIFDPEDSTRIKIEELGYVKKSEYNFNGVIAWEYENRN